MRGKAGPAGGVRPGWAFSCAQNEPGRVKCYQMDMNVTGQHAICSVATPGVEVVTVRTEDGHYLTEIHGGPIDGERFTGDRDPERQHHRACVLARTAEW